MSVSVNGPWIAVTLTLDAPPKDWFVFASGSEPAQVTSSRHNTATSSMLNGSDVVEPACELEATSV